MTTRCTLVTDGSSDQVLVPVIEWVLRSASPAEFQVRWADTRGHGARTLAERVRLALFLHEADLVFVHRDAESGSADDRHAEIRRATPSPMPLVCVVPVRMQEAWLLHDERAIREAADRPSGCDALGLPPASRWESIADPKGTLHRALRTASGATGRRARKFDPHRRVHRLAQIIDDWSPLRALPAFRRLEDDTRQALVRLRVPVAASPPTHGS